jgi:phage shock protein A
MLFKRREQALTTKISEMEASIQRLEQRVAHLEANERLNRSAPRAGEIGTSYKALFADGIKRMKWG